MAALGELRLGRLGRDARAAAAGLLAAHQAGTPPAELLERGLAQLHGSSARGVATSSPQTLSELLVAVTDAQPGESVCDPATGEGNALLAAARHTAGHAELAGQELDPTAALVAAGRLRTCGYAGDVRRADSKASPPEPADVVLLDPPFVSDKPDKGFLASWLTLAASCMASPGRAAVALPERTLNPGRRELPAVADLLEAVVVAPPLREDVADRVAIWVLSSGASARGVLVVDLSAQAEGSLRRPRLGRETTERTRTLLAAWRAGRRLPRRPAATAISRDQLEQSGGDLRPATWLGDTSERASAGGAGERVSALAVELRTLVNKDLLAGLSPQQRLEVARLSEHLAALSPTEDA